jgi:hypothetical protein
MIVPLLASGDCERIRDGLIAQPVNTASSVAYLVVGVALVERARRTTPGGRGRLVALGLATAANGVGSAAYHGPGGPGSRWLHDAAVLAVLGLVVANDAERLVERGDPRRAGGSGAPLALAVASGAALLAVAPATSVASQVALMAGAVAAEIAVTLADRRRGAHDRLRRRRGRHLLITGVVAATLHATSRTGAPLCSPDSVLQGHAGWHVLTALLLWWWASPGFGDEPRISS